MKKIIKAGATDQTIDILVLDSSSTIGAGLTGLVYNSASLVCYYRKGATGSATSLALATQTVGGAHSDGGFVEISSANMPGMYRLDLSDTIVATAGSVTLMLKGATNMAPVAIELQVVAVNLEDAVRMGITALPNANADAAGGLPISDAGGLDLDSKLANTNEVTTARMGALTDWINGGRLDLILDDILADTAVIGATGAGLTSLATASALTTVEGKIDTIDGIVDTILVDTNELQVDWVNGGRLDNILDARASQTSVDTVDTVVDSILVDTAEIGAAGAGLTVLATAANLSTVAGYLDTEIAAILADTNELQTDWANGGRLDLIVDAILADTDVIGATGAGLTSLASASNLATLATYVDTEVAAIKAKTDQFVFTVANQVDANALSGGGSGLDAAGVRAAVGLASANLDTQLSTIDTVVDSILVDTAEIGAAGAGLTALASAANLSTVAGYLDTEIASILADTNELQTDWVNGGRLDLLVDAIKAKTDNLPADPADQSAVEAAITAATSPLATAAALDVVDNFIDTEITAIKAKTDLIPAAPAAVGDIPTAAAIVNEWESQSQADPTGFHVNVKEMNSTPVIGIGTEGDKWRA